jgi:hypothetical protein
MPPTAPVTRTIRKGMSQHPNTPNGHSKDAMHGARMLQRKTLGFVRDFAQKKWPLCGSRGQCLLKASPPLAGGYLRIVRYQQPATLSRDIPTACRWVLEVGFLISRGCSSTALCVADQPEAPTGKRWGSGSSGTAQCVAGEPETPTGKRWGSNGNVGGRKKEVARSVAKSVLSPHFIIRNSTFK